MCIRDSDKGLITLDRSDVTKVVISADFTNGGHTYFNGSNTNVGIGTDTPSQKLDVNGNVIANTYYVGNTSNYIDVSSGLRIRGDSNGINFVPNGSEAMRILANGNVGIGTTTPSHRLKVLGSTSNIIVAESTGNSAYTKYIASGQTSNVAIGVTNGNDLSFRCDGGKIQFNVGNVPTSRIRATIDESGNLFMGGQGAQGTINSRLSVFGNLNEILTGTVTINLGGTTVVGVGTLFLTELEVGDAYGIGDEVFTIATITDNLNLTVTQGSPEQKDNQIHRKDSFILLALGNGDKVKKVVVDRDGNVGIGTTSPTEKLEVDGIIKVVHTDNSYANYRGQGVFFNRTDSYLAPLTDNTSSLNIGYNGGKWSNVEINADIIKFENGANERMRITSDGNVGIGTTNPLRILDIITDSTTDAVRIKNTNNNGGGLSVFAANGGGGTNRILTLGDSSENVKVAVIENGNFGIGISNPSEKLEVDGNAKATSFIKDGGTSAEYLMADGSVTSGAGGGVTKIIAGTGVTISPVGGTGDVTINASGGGGGSFLPLTGGTLSGNLTITKSSATMKVSEPGGGDIRMVAGGATAYIGTYNNTSLQIVQNTGTAITIDTSRNVGIGTTSPNQKLDVNGNINVAGGDGSFLTFNNGDANITIHNNNVGGIGCLLYTSPSPRDS